jgi:hypothetical protein
MVLTLQCAGPILSCLRKLNRRFLMNYFLCDTLIMATLTFQKCIKFNTLMCKNPDVN